MWKNNAFEHEFFFHVFVVQKIIIFYFAISGIENFEIQVTCYFEYLWY